MMNERIQKLVEQARKYAWENETHWSANAEREALFEEKFAELIVRECVDVARQADIDGCNIGNYAWEKINQHFGVEE